LKVEELDCVGLGWTGPSWERRAAKPRSGSEASSSTPTIGIISAFVHLSSNPIASIASARMKWKLGMAYLDPDSLQRYL
jgi:hypothetical protein